MPARSDIDQAVNRQVFTESEYSYPLTPAVHNIVFIFREYAYNNDATRFVRPTSSVSGAVVMPLPTNLTDTYSVQIGEANLGGLGSLTAAGLSETADVTDDVVSDIRAGIAGSDIGTLSEVAANARSAARFFRQNIIDSVPGLGDAISVGTGTAVNPHIALNFDGVSLKKHQFNWTLSPKNEVEAERIRNIIRRIQMASAPSYDAAGTEPAVGRNLLRYPEMVDISFVGINQAYFYYFKPAMITNLSVNYSPNGIALNKGGRPAVVQIDLSVTETRIVTKEDYSGANPIRGAGT